MQHLILFISFCLFSFPSFAQLKGTIQTGRPGQGIGAGIIPVGAFQLQTGFDHQNIENNGLEQTNQTMNNVLRFGLSETFEVRSIIDYSQNETSNNGLTSDQSGISQFQLGFRYNLLPNNDESWIPMFAIQTQFRMKQVSRDFTPNEVAPNFVFVATKNITNSWSAAVNYGIAYNGFDTTPTYNFVINATKALSRRWSTLYEIYGNERAEQRSTYYGIGLGYLLHDNFMFDAYASMGNNRGIDEVYVSLGFSWRTLVIENLATALD